METIFTAEAEFVVSLYMKRLQATEGYQYNIWHGALVLTGFYNLSDEQQNALINTAERRVQNIRNSA